MEAANLPPNPSNLSSPLVASSGTAVARVVESMCLHYDLEQSPHRRMVCEDV